MGESLMSEELTIEDLMGRMPKAFQPEAAEGVNAVVQYHLSGEQGGDWVVRIGDGTCTVDKGTAETANLTLTADAADYQAIITGKLNAMAAFAGGKLKLKGDLPLAMKLMTFFKMPA
jgi:putative sterol carrier protein